jgi:hypothetical protein
MVETVSEYFKKMKGSTRTFYSTMASWTTDKASSNFKHIAYVFKQNPSYIHMDIFF